MKFRKHVNTDHIRKAAKEARELSEAKLILVMIIPILLIELWIFSKFHH